MTRRTYGLLPFSGIEQRHGQQLTYLLIIFALFPSWGGGEGLEEAKAISERRSEGAIIHKPWLWVGKTKLQPENN